VGSTLWYAIDKVLAFAMDPFDQLKLGGDDNSFEESSAPARVWENNAS
jgi:hypothetical protein